jgi:hypothetical protein
MPEARDATAIDDLEDASFGFYGGVSSLIEQAPRVTVALRRPVAVVHAGALFFAGAGTNPRVGKTFSKDSSPLGWIWETAPVRTAF